MSRINIHTAYKESVTVPIEEAISSLESAATSADGVTIPVFGGKDSLGISPDIVQEIISEIQSAKNTLSSTNGSISSYLDGFDNAERTIESCLRETTGVTYSLIESTLYELHDAREKYKNTSGKAVYDPSYPSYYNYVYDSLDKKVRKNIEEQLKAQSSEVRIDPNTFAQYYQTIFPYCGITYGKEDITVLENACGIVCGAMILTNMYKKVITPKDIIDIVGNEFTGKETGWGTDITYIYLEKYYDKLGIDREKLTIDGSYVNDLPSMNHLPASEIANKLDGNTVFLVSIDGKKEDARVEAGKERLFTSAGHYILITGVDDEGNYIVADPNGYNSYGKGYDKRHFTAEELESVVSGYTIVTYNDK